MQKLRKLSALRVLAVFGILALVLSACTAPAATTTAPAAEATTAPAAASSDLPAEAGRGTDGDLTLLYWQPVSILNAYLSNGTKDNHGSSLILEPLMRIDPDGNMVATLVTEVPTVENGGVSEDSMSITYNLKPGLLWSDGTPVTPDDVIFTWTYCTTPETGCSQAGSFNAVDSVEAVDTDTVKINFKEAQPYPYVAFVGQLTPVLQKAQFADCVGAAAQSCSDQNTHPIGTGPYKVKDFVVNDTVVYDINENYREANEPHFATVTIKGAADAVSAARAVLETGEADYGWNLQVEPAILQPMVDQGNGETMSAFGGNVERILFNFTNVDPSLGDPTQGGTRGEWTEDDHNPHPFLSDMAVRQALSMAIDRNLIQQTLYGAGGKATANVLAGPPAVVSTANDALLTQDIEGAKKVLEDAGWVDSNGDGVREKDGVELRILYQTSTNAVRQKTQALVQQWWQEIGVATELKNVDAGVYFGGDPASPDTIGKFWADVEMYTATMDNPDPYNYLQSFQCIRPDGTVNIANSTNQWLGTNHERWCSPEYDDLLLQLASATGDERNTIATQLNDMIAADYVNAPLIFRASVSARSNTLDGVWMNGWDSEEWNIAEWSRAR